MLEKTLESLCDSRRSKKSTLKEISPEYSLEGLMLKLKLQYFCCRKVDPFQGPKLGSCLTLGNELSEDTHVLTKREILLGKGTRVESSRVREPRRIALLRGSQSRVLW